MAISVDRRFFLVVTATFRQLYVFVMIEHASRRLVHMNVTPHPTAVWTLQQLREAIAFEDGYRYLLHDRDSIFAEHLDAACAEIVTRPRNATMSPIGLTKPSIFLFSVKRL